MSYVWSPYYWPGNWCLTHKKKTTVDTGTAREPSIFSIQNYFLASSKTGLTPYNTWLQKFTSFDPCYYWYKPYLPIYTQPFWPARLYLPSHYMTEPGYQKLKIHHKTPYYPFPNWPAKCLVSFITNTFSSWLQGPSWVESPKLELIKNRTFRID